MNSEQEFETKFYQNQNELMTNRYKLIFKKNKKNWTKYFGHAKKQLRNNTYWIWIFLCGFEKFIKDNQNLSDVTEQKMFDDANQRIARIIGNHFKIKNYLDSI